MKCTNKKQPDSRRQQVRKQLFLIALLAFFLLTGIISLIIMIKSRELKEILPYDKSTRIFETSVQESTLTAQGVADHLCVGASDTKLKGINGRDGELAGLFDISKKEIPFSRGMHEPVSPGKITQLMTVLLAYEKLDMEKTVEIDPDDVLKGRSVISCGLSAGSTIPVKQLINAVLVSSAEDACLALARTTGKSVENFVELMNDKAQELGMTNTHFVNATGYSDEEQYITVYDIYLLLNEFLQYPDLTNAMGFDSYTLNYTKANGNTKQRVLTSDNLYNTGKLSAPKGVTILGGKSKVSKRANYMALLAQNNYGDAFAVIVMQTEDELSLYERIDQMLEKTNP